MSFSVRLGKGAHWGASHQWGHRAISLPEADSERDHTLAILLRDDGDTILHEADERQGAVSGAPSALGHAEVSLAPVHVT